MAALAYQDVTSYFEGKGLSRQAAAGIAGNLKQESGLDPNAAGGGLAQWTGGRWDASGKSARQQLDQIWAELSGSEIGTLHKLQKAATPEDAARTFSNLFERPGMPMIQNREKYAKEAFAARPSGGAAGKPGPLGALAEGVSDAGKAIASPFEAIGSGLGATAKLAELVGEWLGEPLKPLKLLGGGILIYMGLRTLTRTGAGGSVASEVRYATKPITSVAAPARAARRIKRPKG